MSAYSGEIAPAAEGWPRHRVVIRKGDAIVIQVNAASEQDGERILREILQVIRDIEESS